MISAFLKGSYLLTYFYFWRSKLLLYRQLDNRLKRVRSTDSLHGNASKNEYDQYGQRELQEYETGTVRVLEAGKLVQMPCKKVRDFYLQPVKDAVEAVIKDGIGKVRVLEVGCGNSTNLMLLKEQFGDRVELTGIDISKSRIDTGREYWGERLNGINLMQADATDLRIFEDDRFDLVYSICALEQITYRLHEALSEMVRLSKKRLVFVEPVFEFGNSTQRLYNIVGDQCRTLLPELNALNIDITEKGLMPVLHNPLNPVGLVVAQKRNQATFKS